MFNRGVKAAQITFNCSDARLTGKWTATDLWQHKNLGDFDSKITLPVGAHFCGAAKTEASFIRAPAIRLYVPIPSHGKLS